MEQNTRIKPTEELVNPDQTDAIGTCLIDNKNHFFRQDKDKVLHIAEGIINTLDVNHIESSRQNWGDRFEKITAKEFDDYMQIQLNKFFE
jgi:hypothetical protein